jgi:hypothetical protein
MPTKKTKNSADEKKSASGKKTVAAATPLKKGNVKPLRPTS